MTTHTKASVLAEFTGALKGNEVALHAIDARRMAAALAEARNALEAHVRALDEAMIGACIGVFNAGDDPKKAINDLGMWSQGVGGYFAQEELARVRPVVEAARQWVEELSHDATDMGEWINPTKQRIVDAVRAADAEERPDAK